MILGVVGGIASGKSTVVQMFSDCGAEVLDADREAHKVLETPSVKRELASWLGSGVLHADGTVDRQRVAERVFADSEELRRLEDLVHPRVRAVVEAKIRDFQRQEPGKLLVLDVPLLLESPLKAHCDAIAYVDADMKSRQRRVAARGWSRDELERRERFQTDTEEKRRLADWVIDNSGDLSSTRRQVEEHYGRLKEESENL